MNKTIAITTKISVFSIIDIGTTDVINAFVIQSMISYGIFIDCSMKEAVAIITPRTIMIAVVIKYVPKKLDASATFTNTQSVYSIGADIMMYFSPLCSYWKPAFSFLVITPDISERKSVSKFSS